MFNPKSVLFGLAATMLLAACGGVGAGASFDYETADNPTRTEFLERVAGNLAKKDAIKQHYMAKVMDVKANASARKVFVGIDLVIGFPNGSGHATTPKQRQVSACRAYLKTKLPENRIKMQVAYFVSQGVGNAPIERINLDSGRCGRLVGTS